MVDIDRDGRTDFEHAYSQTWVRQGDDSWTFAAAPAEPADVDRRCRPPVSASAKPRVLAHLTATSTEPRAVAAEYDGTRHQTDLVVCNRAGQRLREQTVPGQFELGPNTRLADVNRDHRPESGVGLSHGRPAGSAGAGEPERGGPVCLSPGGAARAAVRPRAHAAGIVDPRFQRRPGGRYRCAHGPAHRGLLRSGAAAVHRGARLRLSHAQRHGGERPGGVRDVLAGREQGRSDRRAAHPGVAGLPLHQHRRRLRAAVGAGAVRPDRGDGQPGDRGPARERERGDPVRDRAGGAEPCAQHGADRVAAHGRRRQGDGGRVRLRARAGVDRGRATLCGAQRARDRPGRRGSGHVCLRLRGAGGTQRRALCGRVRRDAQDRVVPDGGDPVSPRRRPDRHRARRRSRPTGARPAWCSFCARPTRSGRTRGFASGGRT